MRFTSYLNENMQSILNNITSDIANIDSSTMDYQSKIHWYEFVDFVQRNGTEDNLIKFINQMFHKNITSLDDVNLKTMKPWNVNESSILPMLSSFVKTVCGKINITSDIIKKCVFGLIILFRIYAPQRVKDIIKESASISKAKELIGKQGMWGDFKKKLNTFLGTPNADVSKEWQYAFRRASGWTHNEVIKQLNLPKNFKVNK